MFLLGTAKNLGAQKLVEAVEALLDLIVQRDCLIVDSASFSLLSCSNHADALINSTWTIRGCFDQVDRDARSAVADLARCELEAAAGYYGNGRKFDDSSSALDIPELDMIFTHALFQSRPS